MARLTFLGHAAFRVEGGGLDGLIDPFLTGNSMTPFSPEDFKDVNFIFVTHGHGDHLGDTPAIAKRTGQLSWAALWATTASVVSSSLERS